MSPKDAINKQLLEKLDDVERDIEDAIAIMRHKIIVAQEIKALIACPHEVLEYSSWAELSWYKCKACGAEASFAD